MNKQLIQPGRRLLARSLAAFALLLACGTSGAADAPGFEPDPGLATNARKWATEFVTFANDRYDVSLDWSQVSIKYLDDIVNDLHGTYTNEQPEEALVTPIARALGSYIAEVYRIFYGGDWGWIILESGAYPGIKTDAGATFLPLKRAIDRIKLGDDPDIWEYFQLMSAQ